MAKIVVGVCGSVAAVRTIDLVRELRRRGHEVEVAMTESAKNIINPFSLQWASDRPVITELTGAVEHVRLCGIDGECEILLICPATANTISKIAGGIDDTTVTTFASTAIGSKKEIVIVPAMHLSMYENPFVIENIERLKNQNITIMEPILAENKAKIPENDEIIKLIESKLK